MASSNTTASGKATDPYKAANLDNDISVAQKIEDLSHFMNNCKFGMMTTRDASSGHLVSRCMALAGQVRQVQPLFPCSVKPG